MPFTLPKFVFGNKIFSDKINKSTFCIILKIAFAKKINDNINNLKLIFCGHVCKASKFFAKNN